MSDVPGRRHLHWRGVVDRARFRICVQVFRCLHNMPLGYMSILCQPVFGVPGRRYLRSADRGHLDIWTSLVSDWLYTAVVHLLTPARQAGTHFLLTSKTTGFLSQLSNATVRPFSSLSNSTRLLWVLSQKNLRRESDVIISV